MKKFALYTNIISPHQLPLAREVCKVVGADNYCYIYEIAQSEERHKSGWNESVDGLGIKVICSTALEVHNWLKDADVLLFGGVMPIELVEQRLLKGLKTFYQSERWFKPVWLGVSLPGWIRMLVPSYRKMAKRFVKWANSDKNARILAIGPWAKKDFLRMGVKEEKIVDWGYFVAPSDGEMRLRSKVEVERERVLKVLWVGRMIGWKRVDTIIRAVARLQGVSAQGLGGSGEGVSAEGLGVGRKISLTLVGDGPERKRLEGLVHSAKLEGVVKFMPSQPIAKIREIMRAHDVYVLASDESEGWGAALNEALEEGMNVIGTFEAGASAAILPKERLYHAGDARELARLLELERDNRLPPCSIGDWTAAKAAEKLLSLCGF